MGDGEAGKWPRGKKGNTAKSKGNMARTKGKRAPEGESRTKKQRGGSSAVAATAKGLLQALGLGGENESGLTEKPAKDANQDGAALKELKSEIASDVASERHARPGGKKRKQQRSEGEKRDIAVASGKGKPSEPSEGVEDGEGRVKPSGKAQKRMKVLSHIHTKGEVFTPSKVSERAFDTDPTDHCETPFEAYRDIEPFLFRIAHSLGKSKGELSIYDPYYCEGSMVKHLHKLGFRSIYNKNEDFYRVIKERKVPSFDVLVTNPPFSGDHMKKIVQFCVEQRKPFFLLMPNFVLKKTYFKEIVAAGPPSIAEPSFLAPEKAYKFWSPGRTKFCSRFVANTRGGVGDAVPFETIWYIGGYSESEAGNTLKWWGKKYAHSSKCTFAPGESQLPERVVPVRVTGGEKRPNPRQRKALAKKRRAGVAVS